MSTFTEEDRYDLADYELSYHHPDANDPNAILSIVAKSDGTVENNYNLINSPLGLQIDGDDLVIGLADHGDDSQNLLIDFSLNPSFSSFHLGTNPSNSRLGGIGLEDLRDASRTSGTINKHYFYLDTEPINISFSNTLGSFVVEIRDLNTYVSGNDTWYELVLDSL